MTQQDVVFIEKLWNRLKDTEFVPLEFAKLIRRDGGHDMSNLSEEDVMQLFKGEAISIFVRVFHSDAKSTRHTDDGASAIGTNLP